MVFSQWSDKDYNYILMVNTYNGLYSDPIDGTICKVIESRGLDKFIICDQNKGVYFSEKKNGESDVKTRIFSFINEGETIIKKEVNDSKVLFINGDDSLLILYEIDENRALVNGAVISRN